MSSGPARRRGSRSRAALGALLFAGASFGCGSAAQTEDAEPVLAEGYEGPNFYEPSNPSGASDGATGQAPPLPSNAPGFFGFVSGDEPLSVCPGTVAERTSPNEAGAALACPRARTPVISDFTFVPGMSDKGLNFDAASSIPGGTYFYPDEATKLRSDVTADDWHLSGRVESVSGFGLYLNGCSQLDASSYRGIAFSVRGSIGDGGGLVFFIGTATNQVSHVWVNANKPSPTDPDEPPNAGRCQPVAGRYDGTCRESRIPVPVTEATSQVQVSWRDLVDGCPATVVDPREITTIAWYFPQSSTGAYSVDIHIDDLRFTDGAPL